MAIARVDFSKDSNIGLYGFATDEYCLTGHISKKPTAELEKALGVKAIKSTIIGTDLAGIFSAGNSNGVIVSDRMYSNELKTLKSKLNVLVLETKYTAIGNLILSNDRGCVVSGDLREYAGEIGDFLGVKPVISTLWGLEIIGSLSITTNKGCIVTKEASEEEIKILEKTLKVKLGYSTVNYGSSFVRSGVIANSNGAAIGYSTTGPEMQLVAEALGLI